ncbi:hypothetical protein [Humibacillus sp. DSM 29435]|uniref:hypothetical protein n=1 Tax=Humibacillus sp. DSM 29435 TaxID=1869167 RepID=UPI001586CA25|nr:hypothetical protein [Humibacillus sp. DSM 29435]
MVIATVTLVAAITSGLLLRAGLDRNTSPPGAQVSRDLDGNRVVWQAAPELDRAKAKPTGGRFVASRQKLSVPLLAASVVDGVITPPTFTDAFVMRDYGQVGDPSTGLVVVTMHSVRGGRGPGNAFINPPTDAADDASAGRHPLVFAGDPLTVDGVAYVVTGTAIETKGEAARDPRIWRDRKSRGDQLVVITCLLSPAVTMSSQDNLIVFANRA